MIFDDGDCVLFCMCVRVLEEESQQETRPTYGCMQGLRGGGREERGHRIMTNVKNVKNMKNGGCLPSSLVRWADTG